MEKNFQKSKKTQSLLWVFLLLFCAVSKVEAAPDLVLKNITGSGDFVLGQNIQFSFDMLAEDESMNTSNTFGLKDLGENGPFKKGSSAPANNFVVNGNYAYLLSVGSGNDLYSYDITNTVVPEILKSLDFTDTVDANAKLFLHNGYGYVSMTNELAVLDFSDSARPSFLKKIDIRGGTSVADFSGAGMAVSGNYLYVSGLASSPNNNLYVIDISDPANPSFVSGMKVNCAPLDPLSTSFGSLVASVNGDYLYVGISQGEKSLEVYSIKNPATPVFIKDYGFSEIGSAPNAYYDVSDLEIDGNYMFAGMRNDSQTGKLVIFNISNASNPFISSKTSISGGKIYDLEVVGNNYVYMALHDGSSAGSITIWEASDKSKEAVLVNNFQTYAGKSLAMFEDRAYFLGETLSGGEYSLFFEIYGSNTHARVCIDNSNCMEDDDGIVGPELDTGVLEKEVAKNVSVNWVGVTGSHTAYFCVDLDEAAGDKYSGLVRESDEGNNCTSVSFVVSETPQPDMKPDGEISISGNPVVNQNISFIADLSNSGSEATGTTNTYSYKTGSIDLGSALVNIQVWDVEFYGNYAMVLGYANGKNYLLSVDISDRAKPQLKKTVEIIQNVALIASAMEISGNYLYLGGQQSTNKADNLWVYDISDPLNPLFVKKIWTVWPIMLSLKVSGNYLYAGFHLFERDPASSFERFAIFDISNQANPVKVGSIMVYGNTIDMDVVGSYAYLAIYNSNTSYSKILIYNISDKANPVKEGEIDIGGFLAHVRVSGSHLFVSKYSDPKVGVWNVSDPKNPKKVSEINASGSVTSMELNNPYLFVGSADKHISIYDISAPESPILKNKLSGGEYALSLNGDVMIAGDYDTGVGEPDFYVHELSVFSRVCVDSVDGAQGCLNDASGRVGTDYFDGGVFAKAETKNITQADWNLTYNVPGTHLAYFCADPKSLIAGTGPYDGVDESDETNNCVSKSFEINTGEPVTGACNTTYTDNCQENLTGTEDLCLLGTTLGNFSGGGPWSWQCSGLFGGEVKNCSASKCQTIEMTKYKEVTPQ